MAALQCDICGGKLMGKPGGVFECDSCGMEYSTEWAKAKIQEIRGTVTVEGTVQVAGTVKVDGPVKVEGGVSVQSLCDRGFFELENGSAEAAEGAFRRALDMDLNWGDVYTGLIMCEYSRVVRTRGEFRVRLLRHEFDRHSLFLKFLHTPGSSEHREQVAAYQQMLEEEKAAIAENRRRGKEKAGYYARLRKKYHPVRGRITIDGEYVLDKYGTLYSRYAIRGADFSASNPWENMLWISKTDRDIATLSEYLIGMYADGTVIAENRECCVEVFDPSDRVTEFLGMSTACFQAFVGLQENGNLLTSFSGDASDKKETILAYREQWKNKKVDALCELTNKAQLKVVVPSDETLGTIAWTETGPYTGHRPEDPAFRMVATLRTDGTVFLENSYHYTLDTQVALWSDIIQVVAGETSVAGLKEDGTVLYAHPYITGVRNLGPKHRKEKLQNWQDIVFIRMKDDDVIGVRKDGTLITTGGKSAESLAVRNGVQLFEDIDTLADETRGARAEAFAIWKRRGHCPEFTQEQAEDEATAQQRSELQSRLDAIHDELAALKGIFSMKRRRELEEQMGRILLELDELG